MKSESTEASPTPPTLKSHGLKKAPGPGLISKAAPATTPDYRVELSSKKIEVPELPALPTPKITDVAPVVTKEIKIAANARLETASSEAKPPQNGSLKRPAIIFMKGLDILSSPLKSESGYAGLGRIAEAVEGSRLYGWDQKEEVLKEVLKTHPDFPVVLVGHSLGGDSAIEVAEELDTLEHKFRPVDLLVTLDAVGIDHHVIPANVKRHLNVFGEGNFLLNGGPHVARDEERTEVKNILSELQHTELDDDRKIQREIVRLVDRALTAGPQGG